MHEGHRQRLYDKLKSGSQLADHEILELLLFTALPRVNTNPLAHDLLDRFRTLSGVLNASADELMSVKGVGARTADFLAVVGACISRTSIPCESGRYLKNFGDVKQFAKERLSGRKSEYAELYLIRKDSLLERIYPFTDLDSHKISLRPEEIIRAFSENRPWAVAFAHNHPASGCFPSADDDVFTEQLQLICSMNNVRLLDHCIVADDGVFSYFDSCRIDSIKSKFTVGNIVKICVPRKI